MTSSLSKAQHEWMVKPGDSGTVMVPRGTSPSTVGMMSEEGCKQRSKVEIVKGRGG
jgi:archaellum component FlaF (FlaF/FlaG flagellin family)